jgi:hypothetical protein
VYILSKYCLPLYVGPGLSADAGSAASSAHGSGTNSLRVVLDGDSSFVENLPKEEKLLLGVELVNDELNN